MKTSRDLLSNDYMIIDDRKSSLEREFNYPNKPGFHSMLSPVVGAYSEDFLQLIKLDREYPILFDLNLALWKYKHMLPTDRMDDLDKIGTEVLGKYITEKYGLQRVTIENIIQWRCTNIGFDGNGTLIYEGNEKAPWHIRAGVGLKRNIGNNLCNVNLGKLYLPIPSVAYHEITHVEETPKNALNGFQGDTSIEELAAMLRDKLITDEIFKRLQGMDLDKVVCYNLPINIGKKSIDLGEVLIFYRTIERKYGNIHKALSSKDSLEFLSSI